MKSVVILFVRVTVLSLCLFNQVLAAEAASNNLGSPTATLLRTMLGLVLVLIVMAFVAWFAKRITGRQGASQSVARIIGGVSVGSRERVVVVEVGNRWLVVGVAAGHLTAIANLGIEDGAVVSKNGNSSNAFSHDVEQGPAMQSIHSMLQNGQSFAARLKQTINQAVNKSHEC